MAMRKVQFTYFNETQHHMSVYRGSLQDYVGHFEPGSMMSFEVEVGDNQAIFLKQWTERMLLIMPIDMQKGETDKPKQAVPPPIPKEYIDLGNKKIEPLGVQYKDTDYMGGGEP